MKNSLLRSSEKTLAAFVVGGLLALVGCDRKDKYSDSSSKAGEVRYVINGEISKDGYKYLETSGLESEVVKKYPSDYIDHHSEVEMLPSWNRLGFTPEIASSYVGVANDVHNAFALFMAGVDAEYAKQFPFRYPSTLGEFKKLEINRKEYDAFDAIGRANEVINFKRAGISLEQASSFNRNVPDYEVEWLLSQGIDGNTTNDYVNVGFQDRGITESRRYPKVPYRQIPNLINAGVTAEEVKKYFGLNDRFGMFGVDVGVDDILLYAREGLTFEDIETKVREASLQKSFGK